MIGRVKKREETEVFCELLFIETPARVIHQLIAALGKINKNLKVVGIFCFLTESQQSGKELKLEICTYI